MQPATDGGRWSADCLRNISRTLPPFEKTSKRCGLRGRGPLVMYGALGAFVAAAGYEGLLVDKPQLPYWISFRAEKAGDIQTRPAVNAFRGSCCGILGDPNSGKSVFSRTFYQCVRELFFDNRAWIYDCDLAAPTRDWYMRGMSSTDEAVRRAYDERRKELKRPWDDAKECKVAQDLRSLKGNLDFVIADMSGGKHLNDGSAPRRITGPLRGNMMEQCDFFIVLCRKDKPSVFADWLEALRPYGLADRVVARIVSAEPEATLAVSKPCLANDGYFHLEISGLDRQKPEAELFQALKEPLRELLDMILPHFNTHNQRENKELV